MPASMPARKPSPITANEKRKKRPAGMAIKFTRSPKTNTGEQTTIFYQVGR